MNSIFILYQPPKKLKTEFVVQKTGLATVRYDEFLKGRTRGL